MIKGDGRRDKGLAEAARRIDKILDAENEEWRAFLDSLGPSYPGPRAELEWLAHKKLRQWWSAEQISNFITAHANGKLEYPGVLGTGAYPSLTEFLDGLELLEGGIHARTLPREEMLKIVAGDEAVQGEKFDRGRRGPRRDALAQLIQEALDCVPQKASELLPIRWTGLAVI